MEQMIQNLRCRWHSTGHYAISTIYDEEVISCVTTNMLAIDAACDDGYDLTVDPDRYYESQEQAKRALVEEILRKNGIKVKED